MAENEPWPTRFEGHRYPQTIPVPDDIRPGAPAPWSALAPQRRRNLTLDLVQARLRDAGHHFETSSMPEGPDQAAIVADAQSQPITLRSAVLVALFEERGETHVVLTRRSFTMRQHSGEIALPGGRGDEGETPVETALREAREEVGIAESSVEVMGWLSPFSTFASGSTVWPVVGLLGERPNFFVVPAEVDRVFTVALCDLMTNGAFLEERWRRDVPRTGVDADGYFPIYFFAVPGDLVWGATARVLTELLCLVAQVPWPDANRVWS